MDVLHGLHAPNSLESFSKGTWTLLHVTLHESQQYRHDRLCVNAREISQRRRHRGNPDNDCTGNWDGKQKMCAVSCWCHVPAKQWSHTDSVVSMLLLRAVTTMGNRLPIVQCSTAIHMTVTLIQLRRLNSDKYSKNVSLHGFSCLELLLYLYSFKKKRIGITHSFRWNEDWLHRSIY